jgi:transcriptional regulator with XRE-family HTH domain
MVYINIKLEVMRMYNLDSYKFGELFRKARKSKGISVKEIADKINKTETTVYKYERNVLMPDLKTVLEICNVLDVGFDDLASVKKVEETKEHSNNPFSVDKLYVYYIGFTNNLVFFELEIKSEGGFQRVYFKHSETGLIYYVGTLESSQDIAYINMKNYYATNKRFEKVEIILNLKYASDDRYMGLINGTYDDTNQPLTKKCMITKNVINVSDKKEIANIKDRLKITEIELKNIKETNSWTMDVTNKTDYNVI